MLKTNMFNLKKNLSYLAILVIGLGLGLGLTYVSAEYTDQTNNAVVGGQTSVINGLSVDGSGDIRAEVPSTSNAPAFFFGNPGGANVNIPNDDDFWQLADQNSPRKF